MESIRPSTLEIMVISGENLCMNQNPVKEAYVVIRAESLKCCTTKMVKYGGENTSSLLSWNEKFLMDIPLHARSITFEVQCKNSNGAVRSVGVARIAISHFLGEKNNVNGNKGIYECTMQKMMSYRLRDWDGRRNGVINFSVRVAKLPEEDPLLEATAVVPEPAKGMPVRSCGFEGRVLGFKVDESNNSNGVAVGIPLWWSYPNNI
ncbi:hypothetical protein HN51_005682 [Arachis hypogaea]|uniref:BON1-associated protein 2 n=1 Tax=Arachis hypogaea TaxID=3818 RepID=UPI000DECEBAD|nr:BON1-associated protein 1 [Arachis hypogaea]